MKKPLIESPAAERGRLRADRAGEYHYDEMGDYVSLTASLLRQSRMKYSHVAKATGMSGTTASNLASGKTHYPRFSTIAGILGALGYETVIRSGAKKP